MNKTHPPIVILDFDGVILPSIGARIAFQQQFKNPRFRWNHEKIKNLQPIDLIRRIERVDTDKNWKMAIEIYKSFEDVLPFPLDRIRFLLSIQKDFRKMEYAYAEFFPYVIPTLEKLSKTAYIGICTNSERKRISYWLSRYSIKPLIAAFTSRGDRKRYGVKPNPRILLFVLLKIKQNKSIRGKIDKSKVYFVGDNVTDILTAKNAGVKSVAVLSGHSTKEEMQAVSPDFLLPSLEEIFSVPDLSYNSS